MRLSHAARIRRTAHTRAAAAAARKEREVALGCQHSLAWRSYVFHRIAPTLSKNVILAEVFLIIINDVI